LLRGKGDAKGALAVLDGLIADQPGALQARLERATIELALKQPDKAKPDIDAVLRALPGHVPALYLLAVLKAEEGDFKAADAELERINQAIPGLRGGYYLRAFVKAQLGQLEQAEEAANRAVAQAPQDVSAAKLLARIQFAKHQPAKAAETLARVTESGRADAETFDLLGRAYAATGQGAESVAAFQKAAALAPEDVGLQTRLANVRVSMGQPEAALDGLEHTLALAPKQAAVTESLFLAAIATGDLDKARDAVAKIRSAQGDTDAVANFEGMLKVAELDYSGAQSVFSTLAAKSPDFLPAQFNLANVLLLQGQRDRAESVLTGILAKHPTSERALASLAGLYQQSGRLPAAIALYERAAAAEPANRRITAALGELYLRAGTPQKTLDLVAQIKGDANAPGTLAMKAAAQLALGQKQQARDTYTALLQANPALAGPRRQLVALLMEAKEFETARNVLKAGIAASPRNYQLLLDYALLDLKASGVDAALATASRLQAQNQDFAPARALKGDVLIAADQPEKAAAAFAEEFTASPSAMLATRLASADIRLGKADAAAAVLSGWLAKSPDDAAALEQLAELNIGRQRYADAAKALEQILRKHPHNPVALNNLAWVYQQLGDSRAEGLAKQAYLLGPSPQTADTLGWILVNAGQNDTGEALLRQASAGTSDPRVLFHYAVALKQGGQRAEAMKLLNSVASAKGDFAEKQQAQKLIEELGRGS
jgi:putative PEP-CTERM system TPR-repeat lipoprotein